MRHRPLYESARWLLAYLAWATVVTALVLVPVLHLW